MTTAAPQALTSVPGAGASSTAVSAAEREGNFWVVSFILIQVATQLAVISPLASARTLFRMASFGSGLVFLVMVRGKGGVHPARNIGIGIVLWLSLGVLHPSAAVLPAAAAQMVFYLAIMAPLFWVPRLTVTTKTLFTLLIILWLFHSVGSLVGVLQVYYPGRFQPNVSPVLLALGHGYVESLKIVTSGGIKVFRPMGLTDVPGGAAGSGLYAAVLGAGVFLTTKRRWLGAVAIGTILLGLMCLYLSQVRALLVITGVAMVVVTATLISRRDYKRLTGFGIVILVVVLGSFRSAVSLAKQSVEQRVGTLTTSSPGQVYQTNRGQFLDEAFNELLPEYPLGAGMGRWGMMNSYFGDKSNPNEALWAEIQWTGWILDGGAPLMVAYVWAVVLTVMITFRISRWRSSRDPTLALWAAVLLGYSIGTCALTFSYPVFLSDTGMEFWLLNLVLFTAARTQARRDALPGPRAA